MANESLSSARRVLLVEDDAFVVVRTRKLLEQSGFDVVGPATQLAKALELAATEQLDVAILDIHLAGAAVWPVAELLRSRKIGFVLLSAWTAEMVVPTFCRDVPRVDKPFRRETLLAALALASPVTV